MLKGLFVRNELQEHLQRHLSTYRSITEAYNSDVVALGLAGRLCHDRIIRDSGSGRKPQGPHHAVWILSLIG
jgi:hypothetical protein